MCDKDDCQLKRDEILSLQCLRLETIDTKWDDLTDNQKQSCVKTIGEFIEAVKTQTTPKANARAANGSDRYNKLKLSLPVWLPCGIGHTQKEFMTSNGFVTIDIDHLDGYEQQVKARLCELPFIALCGLSIGGNGVFALAYAPDYIGNTERIKGELYEVTANFLSAVSGLTIRVKSSETKPDQPVIDITPEVSRKRIETFDHEIYVAEKVKAFEPIADLMAKKWNDSKIKRLAEMMGYNDVMPNHAAVAAILSLAAASAKLTLWDWDIALSQMSYQARIGAIILALSGRGKGILDSNMQDIADRLGITIRNSKSTKNMARNACKACNTYDKAQDIWTEKQIKDINPVIEITDEAYGDKELNHKAQYAMDKPSQRRGLLNRHYNPQTTEKDSLPDYGFTPCYQYLMYSPFEAYAHAIANEVQGTGDERRELVCELPCVESDGLPYAVALIREKLTTPKSDLNGVYQALNAAFDHNKERINSYHESIIEGLTVREIPSKSKEQHFPAMDYESRHLCLFTFYRCLEGLSDANTDYAFTHFANIATISAYLEQRDCITTSDILIAAAITRASFALRDRLQDRCNEITLSDGCDKQITWLNKYWERPDKSVKVANYQKAKVNNGIGLSKVTKETVEKWELNNLVIYQIKTNKYTRRGTPQELEQIEKDLEIENAIKNKSGSTLNEMTLNWNATHGHDEQFATRKRPTFSQDTQDAQRIRVVEMVHKSLEGGKCGYFGKGQRETTLYRLCNVLKNNGMWGTIGKEILEGLARESGLPEKEIQHALR